MPTLIEARTEQPTNVLLLRHPDATNWQSVEERVSTYEALASRGLDFVTHPTEPTLDKTIAAFGRMQVVGNILPDTQIEVVAGDESFSNAVVAAAYLGLTNRLTTSRGGGASDIAAMLHPNIYLRNTVRELLNVPAYKYVPAVLRAKHRDIGPDDPRAVIPVVGYLSAVFSAEVTEVYDSPKFRTKVKGKRPSVRLAHEALAIDRQLPLNKQVIIEDDMGVRDISELTFAYGERMAKIVRFGGLALLEQGAFGRYEITGQIGRAKLAKALASLPLGRFARGNLNDRPVEFTLSAKELDYVVVQSNGTAYRMPSGTSFTLDVARKLDFMPKEERKRATPEKIAEAGKTTISAVLASSRQAAFQIPRVA